MNSNKSGRENIYNQLTFEVNPNPNQDGQQLTDLKSIKMANFLIFCFVLKYLCSS